MKKFVLMAGISCVFVAHVHVVAAQTAAPRIMKQEQQSVRPHAHVHGIGRLQIAVEGNTLMLSLESPLDNLLGFEHMSRTEQQRRAVQDMVARLNKVDTLFVPTLSALCTSESVKLDSPVLEPTNKIRGNDHADLDAEFIFRCRRPDALRNIEVMLFDGFPNLRQLDVQVVSSRGQSAATLSPSQRQIAW